MFKTSKTIIYPGGSGQAAYCQADIVFSKDIVRPKVYILFRHEESYRGSPVVNSEFSCDHAVNKLFNEELAGLSVYDVKIYYLCSPGMIHPAIHKIPFKTYWKPKLTFWQKCLVKLGFQVEVYTTIEQEKCGGCIIRTEDNTPVCREESENVRELFLLDVD